MSISLPQEVQTQRLNSLPDDLRGIAEELIAKKFDIKEEVVSNRDFSFPGSIPIDQWGKPGMDRCTCSPQYATRCPIHDASDSYRRGGFGKGDTMEGHYVDSWRDFQRRVEQIAIFVPSPDYIEEAMRKLCREANTRNWPRDRMIFRMSPDIARRLMQRTDIYYPVGGVSPTFNGINIEIEHGYEWRRIVLETRY